MRYILIGCGRIAPSHIKAALKSNLEIVALCDSSLDNAKALAESFSLDTSKISFFSDYKEAIDSCNADIAAVATESWFHAEIALYCIKKGVHTIIEKPIAMSLKDARAIVDAAKSSNVKVCCNMQNRYNSAIQKLKKAIDGGKFGKISHAALTVRWRREKDYYDQASWRGRWESDGGALMNQCIHGIDLLRWLMGNEIESVCGMTQRRLHPYIEAEDIGVALVKFKSGALATVEGSVNVYPKDTEETLTIFGENATVKIGGLNASSIEIWNLAGEGAQETEFEDSFPESVYGNGHFALYTDFLSSVIEDKEVYVDASAGLRALELVLAIYKSSAENKVINFPLEDVASADFEGLFDK